jgi:hypothetical protein
MICLKGNKILAVGNAHGKRKVMKSGAKEWLIE